MELGMTAEEQQEVTKLMTSGDPAKVAQAATILSGIADLVVAGIPPSQRSESHAQKMTVLLNTSYTNNVLVRQALLNGQHNVARQIRLEEAEVRERRRNNPLPPRMPRYARMKAFDPASSVKRGGLKGIIGVPSIPKTNIGKGPLGRKRAPSLTFVDDSWDGSVGDAFTEIKIKHGIVTRTQKETPGINRILAAAGAKEDNGELEPRVLIDERHNDGGRRAFQKGDAVTHINGQGFTGNAEDLVTLLSKMYENGTEFFDIVVNAEGSVAEALRLRAIC
uniref:PDZ domain-containing protein n=1 Tax=Ditylum brightwellii TaxID=49249 RepID=A0A7S1YYN3_9STRA